jgi:hypothetical protein
MTAGGPSFIDAPRWPIDQGAIRLRMSDRAFARLPTVMARVGDRLAASPQGSKLRRSVLTRALVAGFGAHDRRDLTYLQRMYSPAIRFESRLDRFELLHGVYEGWPEVVGYLQAYWEVAATVETQLLEAIDVGGPFFATRLDVKTTGDFSGLEMGVDAVVLYEFDRGRVGFQWSVSDEDTAERIVADRLAS